MKKADILGILGRSWPVFFQTPAETPPARSTWNRLVTERASEGGGVRESPQGEPAHNMAKIVKAWRSILYPRSRTMLRIGLEVSTYVLRMVVAWGLSGHPQDGPRSLWSHIYIWSHKFLAKFHSTPFRHWPPKTPTTDTAIGGIDGKSILRMWRRREHHPMSPEGFACSPLQTASSPQRKTARTIQNW